MNKEDEEDIADRPAFAKMVFDIFDKTPTEILFGEEHKCEETTERDHINIGDEDAKETK